MQAWNIEHEMEPQEFYNWLAYFDWKYETEKKAAEKARKKSGRK